ncbi:AAWKG family protein, partial [Streptomyces sp. NPDC048473]
MAVDNWEHILHLVTGWTLPERSEITGAKGDSGIPWMNVSIKEIGNSLSPTNSLGEMGATFQFYTGKGNSVGMYQADISYTDISLGKQFWTRTDFALSNLLNNHTTVGLADPVGGAPAGTGGVDMHTFSKVAASFDAAGDFFANRTEILKQWLESLGDEQAAWKGKAASVFWNLLDDLHSKYENFTAQLRPPGFQPQNHSLANPGYQTTTLHGDSLIGAELSLHNAIQKLYDQYNKFFWQQAQPISYTMADGSSASQNLPADPRDIMNQLMADIANWITGHNWNHVTYTSSGQGGYNGHGTAPTWGTSDGFSSSPSWGNLQDTSTWSAIANEAVRRWTTNVQTNLDTPAVPVVTELQQNWTRVLDPNWNTRFAFEDRATGGGQSVTGLPDVTSLGPNGLPTGTNPG